MLYVENAKESTKQLILEVIINFSKDIGHKINIQKISIQKHKYRSTALLNNIKERSKNKVKKTILFTIASSK